MRRLRTALALAPLVLPAVWALAAPPEAAAQAPAKPPFAGEPDAPKVPPKPDLRTWAIRQAPFTLTLEFQPGIPTVGEVVEIRVAAIETPKTPHPRWGLTVPLTDAAMVATLTAPDGAPAGRYVVHPKPLAGGKYGFHFTPSKEGLHQLRIAGRLPDGRAIDVATKVPVDVWPLPAALEGTGDTTGAVRRRVIVKPGQ